MSGARDGYDNPTWDYAYVTEVTILRPAADVWAHFVGKAKDRWTGSDYSTVAGEVGAIGEVFTHAHRFNGVRLFYEAIKVKPKRLWVLKITYEDNETHQRHLIGYDFHTFRESAGATTVVFEQALALPRALVKDNFVAATERQDRKLTELFENLKRVAEADAISTMQWARHTQMTLERPLADVWPIFRDIRRWYSKYSFDVISGESYETGPGLAQDQVLRLTSATPPPRTSVSAHSLQPQHLVTKMLKVVPQQEIVSVLSGSYYDWKQFTVFYVWSMREVGTTTTILIDTYGEAEFLQGLSKGAFASYCAEEDRHWHRSWADAFVNLKKLVDTQNLSAGENEKQPRSRPPKPS